MGKTKHNNFVEILKYRAKEQPNKIAYTFLVDGENEEVTITYSELNMRAESIANELRKTCSIGDRALLMFPSGLEFISAFFGCLFAGVIAVPAYPPRKNRKMDRLKHIVADCEPKTILSTMKIFDSAHQVFNDNYLLRSLSWIKFEEVENINYNVNRTFSIPPNQLAFIQYTSGSTGNPKGVMVSHENIIENSLMMYNSLGYSSKTIMVSWLPLFHDMGLVGAMFQSMFGGFNLILMAPGLFLLKPVRWLKVISKYKATATGAPNFAIDICNDIKEELIAGIDISSLKVVYCGAEPINADTVITFSNKMKSLGFNSKAFYPCYGMAEATLFMTGSDFNKKPTIIEIDKEKIKANKFELITDKINTRKQIVSCGNTDDNHKVIIVDPNTKTTCKNGEVGEIWFSGKSVGQGYWKKEDLNKEIFHSYTSDTNSGPFLRTGDLGVLQDQKLYITGRLKDVIIIRGRNHYPQDIENSVSEAHETLVKGGTAAFSIESGGEEKLIVIQEIKRASIRNLNTKDVFEAIKKAIAEEHELQVHDIVLIKPMRLFKTSSGKVQRTGNKNAYVDNAFEDIVARLLSDEQKAFVAPNSYKSQSTEILDLITAKIANFLNIPTKAINVNASFESFGLDSLKAIRLIGELSEEIGIDLSPTLVYDYPSIASLSNYLVKGNKETSSCSGNINSATEDIAIIGMSCRFPGAEDIDSFWELLINGKDAISEMPTCRKKLVAVKQPKGGYLTNIDKFDADFFGISPKEAKLMDPQQRILLEQSYCALHSAGINTKDIAGSNTGVFIGISQNDYSRITINSKDKDSPYLGTGGALSIAANRLSYFYNLKGPSLAIDTACSSSLVAIHQAKNSLLNGECELAIVGGVNLNLSTDITNSFQKANMMASDNRCKVFDASADGYVRSEGCGIVILKPLSNALKNKDCIQGVIRGIAIVQDGRSNGLSAPNGIAQQTVIKKALTEANLLPEDLSFIETHGTGTELGDPIEIESIAAVYSKQSTKNKLLVSALKANVGHLEPAAGIAGLIKSVLCLQNKRLPKQLHFNNPNPHIQWDKLPIKVPKELTPLSTINNKPLRAGISSFGFGGTNAHLILEEAPIVQEERMVTNAPFILTLSAKTRKALAELVEKYKNYLHNYKYSALPNVCYTSNVSNGDFEHRLAVIGSNREELISKLSGYNLNENTKEPIPRTFSNGIASSRMVFLFAGAGPQYNGMAKELYKSNVTFTSIIDECSKLFLQYFNYDIKDILWGDDPELINNTKFTQPAIFSLEVALTKTWIHLGIQPSFLMGHSFGEYAVACIAGIISLEDGVKLIGARANLMDKITEKGSMLAVFANQEEILPYIKNYSQSVTIAAVNTHSSLTLSGKTEQIKEIKETLDKKGIETRLLKISLASHCPLMKPMLPEFKEIADAINYSNPKMSIISTVTGNIVKDEMSCSDYWVKHIEKPVRFFDGVNNLINEKSDIFLEVGPGSSLLGMVAQEVNEEIPLVSSIKKDENQYEFLLKSLAKIYEAGQKIHWNNYYENTKYNKVQVPSYPFQRKKYWVKLENENKAKTNFLESSKSSIVESLNKGDYNNLAELLKETGKLPKKFLAALPEVLKLLSIKHKEERALSSIKDHFYEIQWKQKHDHLSNGSVKRGHYIIFSDTSGLGESLAKNLQALDCECSLVYHSESYKNLRSAKYQLNPAALQDFNLLLQDIQKSSDLPIEQVIYLWGTESKTFQDYTQSATELMQFEEYGGILHLVQSLLSFSDIPKIWFITRAAQVILPNEEPNLFASPLWGLGRVLSLEHRQIWGGMIDLEKQINSNEEQTVLQLIRDSSNEDHLAIRNGKVYEARLVKSSPESTSSVNLDSAATYLITGGLGNLGLHAANWLIEKGAKNLLLISRSKPDFHKNEALNKLREVGGKITVVQADVCDYLALSKIIESVDAKIAPLKGIIHAAGVEEYRLLNDMKLDHLKQIMSPKVLGSWYLHQLTLDMNMEFFITYSSISSVWGAVGYAHYAAGNHFLDALALYRKSKGLPVTNINWGAWEGGGMVNEQQLSELRKRGVNSISPEQGMVALECLVAGSCASSVVSNIDWDCFKQLYEISGQGSLLKLMKTGTFPIVSSTSTPKLDVLSQIESAPINERIFMLTSYVQEEVARILEFDDPELLNLNKGFSEMGIDSLMAVQIKRRLESSFGVSLPVTLLFEYPNISCLANYISKEFLDLDVLQQDKINPIKTNLYSENQKIEENVLQLSEKSVEELIDIELEKLISAK